MLELRLKPIHQTKEASEMAAQKELDKVKKISMLHLTILGRFVAMDLPLQMMGFRWVVSDREYKVTKVMRFYTFSQLLPKK